MLTNKGLLDCLLDKFKIGEAIHGLPCGLNQDFSFSLFLPTLCSLIVPMRKSRKDVHMFIMLVKNIGHPVFQCFVVQQTSCVILYLFSPC